jgi:hypothetical protein
MFMQLEKTYNIIFDNTKVPDTSDKSEPYGTIPRTLSQDETDKARNNIQLAKVSYRLQQENIEQLEKEIKDYKFIKLNHEEKLAKINEIAKNLIISSKTDNKHEINKLENDLIELQIKNVIFPSNITSPSHDDLTKLIGNIAELNRWIKILLDDCNRLKEKNSIPEGYKKRWDSYILLFNSYKEDIQKVEFSTTLIDLNNKINQSPKDTAHLVETRDTIMCHLNLALNDLKETGDKLDILLPLVRSDDSRITKKSNTSYIPFISSTKPDKIYGLDDLSFDSKMSQLPNWKLAPSIAYMPKDPATAGN